VNSHPRILDFDFGQADLSSCDREPIHIPGAIQPHGVLLVIDRQSLAIRQFAGATRLLLGVAPERVVQCMLSGLFDAPTLQGLVQQLRAPGAAPAALYRLKAREGSLSLNALIHTQGELGLIELESAGSMAAGVDMFTQVKSMLLGLPTAASMEDCCQLTATQIRAATGFDRVMVYQFLHDGSGKVIAEDKAAPLQPFLGLHYPATDIPQQARAMYLRNWLRLIPDVNYTPAPLQAAVLETSAEPLDMSQCMLRSVSPIHLEYLRNMGVGATLTLSIVIDNQLWGLIACHHGTPHPLTAEVRAGCELVAQIFSMQLQARIEIDARHRRIVPTQIQEMLTRSMLSQGDVASVLTDGDSPLLKLVPASGAAVFLDGKFSLAGQTPPVAFLAELVDWLHAQHQPLLETYTLGAAFAPAVAFSDIASGLLAVSLSSTRPDYVLWFRPEVVRIVTWAGDPGKPGETGPSGDQLTPRKSFAAWEASVCQQSDPWNTVDLALAHAFRLWLLETGLKRMELARLEREVAFSQQSLVMAELDHRVKNTLANIQALVQHTKAGASSLDDFALALQRRISAMAHAHRLLAASRWQGATVRSLLEEELAPFQATGNVNILIRGEDVLLSPAAALSFTLIAHELASNAAKYGALSVPTGHVAIDWRRLDDGTLELTWQERDGPPVAPPTRRGFGSVIIERSLRHELQGRSTLRFDTGGVCCTLTIPPAHLVAWNKGKGLVHDD